MPEIVIKGIILFNLIALVIGLFVGYVLGNRRK